jgi:hypothetical protein
VRKREGRDQRRRLEMSEGGRVEKKRNEEEEGERREEY